MIQTYFCAVLIFVVSDEIFRLKALHWTEVVDMCVFILFINCVASNYKGEYFASRNDEMGSDWLVF